MYGKHITSPIRYPGAKYWLSTRLDRYIPKGTKAVLSPFFGGGSVEIYLALRGIQVYGYDLFQPVANFWQHWLRSPTAVIEDANGLLNLYSPAELRNIKKLRYPKICMHGASGATFYYIFNRLSFSGLPSSHVKAYHLRYDGHYIRDLRDRPNGRRVFPYTEFWESLAVLPITVENAGFRESLLWHPDIFAFLDPPYPQLIARLYGDSSKYHEDFDHYWLAEVLKDRKQWVMTYNDIPFVRDLYADFRVLKIQRPGDSCGKNKNELLIFSHDIDTVPGPEETLNVEQLLMDTMLYQTTKGGEHFGHSY